MKKKLPIIIICVILLLVLGVGGVFLLKDKKEASHKKESIETSIPNIVLNNQGIPKYIEGTVINQKVKEEEDVFKALNEVRDMYGFKDASKEFKIVNQDSNLDFSYYRLQQVNSGISVYGKQLVVAVDKNNKVSSVTGNYVPDLHASSYCRISEKEAKESLNKIMKTEYDLLETNKYVYIKDDKAITSYVFSIMDPSGYYDLILSGDDGTILDKISKNADIEFTYTGTGADKKEHTITLDEGIDPNIGTVYKFHDPNRNITIVDAYELAMDTGSQEKINWPHALYLIFKSNYLQQPIQALMKDGKLIYNPIERLENAISTMDTFSKAYDYYDKVLGRKSFDNNGAEIFVNIGAGKDFGILRDEEWVNACWNGALQRFFIGSSEGTPLSVAVDISSHEFTHAVIDHTAGLVYEGESGALNEGYADIMGSLIEGDNFQAGESVIEVRDMANPNKYQDPAVKDGKYFFPTDLETYNTEWQERVMKLLAESGNPIDVWTDYDNGGVHINSGVPNHAAYLMYNNGAFESKEEMSKVWYNSLFLMTPTSDFEDCALAIIQSAKNLGIADDKVKIIEDAFVETKMLARDYASLSGKVLDSETNSPIEGATVIVTHKLNGYVNYETTTNADGEYLFEKLPATDYSIRFEKAKYKSEEKEYTLSEDTANFNASLMKIEESSATQSEIVFVMDVSMSMDTSDPSDIRKRIISNILSSLDNDARVALVTFTAKAKLINNGLSNKSVDRKILITDIFNIANDNGNGKDSGTNGKAGLEKALSLFSSNENTRRYIVFLTDGADNDYSGKSYSELIEIANEKGVRILTIGLGGEDDLNETELINVASKTNGKYYHATNSDKLYKFDKRIFEELN